jgi:hypothetical protein
MLRAVLLVLAAVSYLLAALAVSSPDINGHPLNWFYLGFVFLALGLIFAVEPLGRRAPSA